MAKQRKMASGPSSDGAKYHCNYCHADCSGLRISCAECSDFDACLQCFASGAEMGNHKRGHNYQLMDNGTFRLVVPEWTADEEMLLLDAIEQHGLGNWDDISDHVGTKTPQEAKDHFEDIYLWKNIGNVTLPRTTSDIPDHATTASGQLSPGILKPVEPLDIPIQEQQELGYMMYRDDFEREHENDGENLVKNLVCSRDDDELETALKLSAADMYWRVLKERSRWKKIARQYGLITSKHKLIASRRKLSKDDREFKDKIRVFAQFLPSQQWEELVTNKIREKELKEKIKELIRYRRNGLKKITACQEYEDAKLQREKKKELKKRMQVISPPRATKTSGKKDKEIKKEMEDEKRLSEKITAASVSAEFKEKMKNDPCYYLLSDKEKQLCFAIQLQCCRYLTLKTFLLNEYASRRMNAQFKSKPPQYLSSILRNSLQEFFLQSGWMCE
ncbi:transcriptional adapter 2-beta-like isoform X1 [Hydractinia symbiolongicarpus]|uniref:transcriptional adapter 2-beta-like isoform X1 n=2 Tax=Hydractinia symbiolongicarpus TaxID=13093 RepID=UPI00254B53B1|nr:transcriptional adapter 2-beta-like isoform X1 [Hydractinia symbiolongicarpus]